MYKEVGIKRNSNKSIRSDEQFGEFLTGYTEVKGFDELFDLLGARIRYKVTHHHPTGQSDVQYRLGGVLTYVDRNLDYIRLKNLHADKQASTGYGNAWSVQLASQKAPQAAAPQGRAMEGFRDMRQPSPPRQGAIPVIPAWRARTDLAGVSKVARASRHGVIVLSLWYSRPSAGDVQELRELRELVEKYEHAQKLPRAPPAAQARGEPSPPGGGNPLARPKPKNAGAMFW